MSDLLSTSADDRRVLPARIHDHAIRQPGKLAITDGNACLTYADLDGMMDRVAASLQRDGVARGDVIACVASSSIAQALVFLGALRAGAVPALIQPSGSSDQISVMIADSNAAIAFLDATTAASLGKDGQATATVLIEDLDGWLASPAARPEPVEIGLEDPFNVIYSSGTTGVPKGIMLSHGMRVDQFASYAPFGYDTAVTMVSTPLYSSTTLVAFLPTLAYGGTVVLMGKFDARKYLELAEQYRATHTMLVPVQYQRIMDLSDFEVFDLSAFRLKFCTSAPFKVALKARRRVHCRWQHW